MKKEKRKLQAKANAAFAGFKLDNADHPAGDENATLITKSVTFDAHLKKRVSYTLSIGYQMIEDIPFYKMAILGCMIDQFIKSEERTKK